MLNLEEISIQCNECEVEEWNIELLHENYASGLSSWKKHMEHYSK
jgi:hypothetical protein